MSCDTNFSSCPSVLSSDCVKWDGADIACLGITKGMSITQAEALIAEKVCEILDDIDVSGVTITGELIALLGAQDKSIANLFQILLDYSVTLRTLIVGLRTEVNGAKNFTLDFKCMTPAAPGPCDVAPTYDLNTILQLIINYTCSLNDKINNLVSSQVDVVNLYAGYLLKSAIRTCQDTRISKYGDGANTGIEFRGFVPPYCAMPYFGTLSWFDASGRALDGTPVCGFYICNGLNGTPDLRGRTVVGATNGVGGGSLHAQVDPGQNGGYGSYTRWDFGGEIRHRLSIGEMPSHNHDTTQTPHSHSQTTVQSGGSWNGGSSGPIPFAIAAGYNGIQNQTGGSYANISVSNTGGGDWHENRMPYTVAVWIMMTN